MSTFEDFLDRLSRAYDILLVLISEASNMQEMERLTDKREAVYDAIKYCRLARLGVPKEKADDLNFVIDECILRFVELKERFKSSYGYSDGIDLVLSYLYEFSRDVQK